MTVETAAHPQVKTIAVIGTGTMGSGIAQISAAAGFEVVMYDLAKESLDKAMGAIRSSLDKFVQKNKLSAGERDQTMARLSQVTELEALSKADLIIEAIVEKLEAKESLFASLDAICPAHTILASNTSSLSVTSMARATKRLDKVVGMHFFNPAALMKLVEVIRTPFTSDETFKTAWEVSEKLGKTPVETRDTPGFIFNRLIIPYLNEAIWALYEGVGRVADIDVAMKLGGNMPIGPLALLDLIGIDVQEHACQAMFDQTGDPKFRVCPLNRQMVRAGYLGRKTNKGFYDYTMDPPAAIDMSKFRM